MKNNHNSKNKDLKKGLKLYLILIKTHKNRKEIDYTKIQKGQFRHSTVVI